jgi:hypothetical protein
MAMGSANTDDQAAIASAVSAAPASVSANAAVMTMDASGKLRSLRSGSNGFTCFPDDPSSPGKDPMCLDAAAMGWFKALLANQPPPKGKVGFIYMLQGGSDASNLSPEVRKPADGKWVITGPHVMIVGADPEFYAAYPSGANPDTAQPYVMWAGTPYQHLMAPVR